MSSALQRALRVAEKFTPVMKESKFKETGMITADEFVLAGDYLVYHCPTWCWNGAEPSKRKDYLPVDKQFLVTKNVPCYKRCSEMEVVGGKEAIVKVSQDDEEGWVDTHHGLVIEQLVEKAEEMTLEGDKASEQPVAEGRPQVVEDDDSDSDSEPAMNIDDFDAEDDPAVVSEPAKPKKAASDDETFVRTRTYDLNITYDNYYRTPRLWLFGYNKDKQPLNNAEMCEDISQDHVNKTVTIEKHPHLPPPDRACVHPCKHAEVMKKIMTMIEEDGRELKVETYLLVFLKFVQAVIPTVEYDFTQQLAITSA